MESKTKLKKAALTVLLIALIGSLLLHQNRTYDVYRRALEESESNEAVPTDTAIKQQFDGNKTYTVDDIASTMPFFESSHPQLLVWDGNSFSSYNMIHEAHRDDYFLSFRYNQIIPLLVHGLFREFPERFKPGTPPFQAMWSFDDYISGKCINEDANCESDTFAPIFVFGSVPKNKTLLPSAKSFPNPYFIACMYDLRIKGKTQCEWKPVNKDVPFDELERTIFWRGSDFTNFRSDYRPMYRSPPNVRMHFTNPIIKSLDKEQLIQRLFDKYPNLTPRWKAVALTLQARANSDDPNTKQWIDVMFADKGGSNKNLHDDFEEKGLKVTDEPMDPYEMSSKYAYQIDIGGGGGTTWDGTISKLLMKGCLFHHETTFQDWFYAVT